jgi:hypothetical protein
MLRPAQDLGTDANENIKVPGHARRRNPENAAPGAACCAPTENAFLEILPMHLPEPIHLWALFAAGHGLHVMKRASLSTVSRISGTKSRAQWMRTNALNLAIRFFVNAAAFSYWIAHPDAATHVIGSIGVPMNLTFEPGHATAAMFGLSGDSLIDWAAAKVPFLQKEIPASD